MSTQQPSARASKHDRNYLLSEGKRNHVLALWEVERYGRDSFGDPTYISVYGLRPNEWYALGIRLLARTAVECTRDRLADLIGRDIAALAGVAPDASGSVIVDPFAGSGNTLYWMRRHLSGCRSVGFELDDSVFGVTRTNLSIVEPELEVVHQRHETGLTGLSIPDDQLLVVFVAPPWGDALSSKSGLDLRLTQPPVAEIIDLIAKTFPAHKILFAVQLHEIVVSDSLSELTSRCDWSLRTTYDVDARGKNHGLLLATRGWTP